MQWLRSFVEESNRIEGIHHVSQEVLNAHAAFISLPEVTVDALVGFVSINAPGHRLRDVASVPGVRVGNHVAPSSGPHIRRDLEDILTSIESPFEAHCRYEDLHPFTDGNGRSGRALWLWSMRKRGGRDKAMAESLGFLHSFYYQTLAVSDAKVRTMEGKGDG